MRYGVNDSLISLITSVFTYASDSVVVQSTFSLYPNHAYIYLTMYNMTNQVYLPTEIVLIFDQQTQ